MQGHAHPPEKETPARRRRPPPCTQPREPSRASALRGLCRAPREWGPHHVPPKPRFPKPGLQVRPSAADLALPCVRGCGLRRQDGRRLRFSFRPGPAWARGTCCASGAEVGPEDPRARPGIPFPRPERGGAAGFRAPCAGRARGRGPAPSRLGSPHRPSAGEGTWPRAPGRAWR